MTAVTVLSSEVINATMEYGRQGPHSLAARPSSPPRNEITETRKGEEGLAELAQNWFRTDQSACIFENPASDYIS